MQAVIDIIQRSDAEGSLHRFEIFLEEQRQGTLYALNYAEAHGERAAAWKLDGRYHALEYVQSWLKSWARHEDATAEVLLKSAEEAARRRYLEKSGEAKDARYRRARKERGIAEGAAAMYLEIVKMLKIGEFSIPTAQVKEAK